jgi:3-dehydroquinate synthase
LGAARPLDFGHWAAHKLESMTGYAVGHGQAVAIGIALDCTYAAQQRWIEHAERDAILDGMQACGLPLWHPALDRRIDGDTLEVLSGLEDFREHLGGVLCVTYPRPLGAAIEVNDIDRGAMSRACADLKARAAICR